MRSKEARNIADKANSHDMPTVERAIKQAALKGLYEIQYMDLLSLEVREKLKDQGFTVSVKDYTVVISW